MKISIELFAPYMPNKAERNISANKAKDAKGQRKVRTDAAKEAIFQHFTRHADAKLYREQARSLNAAYREAKLLIFSHFAKECEGNFEALSFVRRAQFAEYLAGIKTRKETLLAQLQQTYFATTAAEARAAEKATEPQPIKASELWSNF